MKCIKMHGRVVSVSTCLARQNAKISFTSGPEYLECVNCEQGRLAREGKLNDDDVKELIQKLRLRLREETHQDREGAEMTEKDKTDVVATDRTRQCKSCGVVKPMHAFPKNKECRDGIEPNCKACRALREKQRVALKNGTVPSVSETSVRTEVESLRKPDQGEAAARNTEVKKTQCAGSESRRDPVSPENAQSEACRIITVDLTRHEEVYRSILKIAEEEERTPEGQVRYWLKHHLVGSRSDAA